MSTAFRVDHVEAALLELLRSSIPAAYRARVNIESLGGDDFDENGNLVFSPPALRLRFSGASHQNLRDNQRLTYQSSVSFEVLCFASDLRGPAEERKAALVLVATVEDQLAGARLSLPDGSVSMPITLDGVSLVETAEGPVDQLFSVSFKVEGIAQFTGANAQPR